MNQTKIIKKLVRDKIPEIILKSGRTPKITVLNDTEFNEALLEKVIEEANELVKAQTPEEVLNELCDLQELIIVVAKNNGFTFNDVENCRIKKLNERGGFEKRYLSEFTEKTNST